MGINDVFFIKEMFFSSKTNKLYKNYAKINKNHLKIN